MFKSHRCLNWDVRDVSLSLWEVIWSFVWCKSFTSLSGCVSWDRGVWALVWAVMDRSHLAPLMCVCPCPSLSLFTHTSICPWFSPLFTLLMGQCGEVWCQLAFTPLSTGTATLPLHLFQWAAEHQRTFIHPDNPLFHNTHTDTHTPDYQWCNDTAYNNTSSLTLREREK